VPDFFFSQLIRTHLVAQRSVDEPPRTVGFPEAEFGKSAAKNLVVAPYCHCAHRLSFRHGKLAPPRAVEFEQASVVTDIDPSGGRLSKSPILVLGAVVGRCEIPDTRRFLCGGSACRRTGQYQEVFLEKMHRTNLSHTTGLSQIFSKQRRFR